MADFNYEVADAENPIKPIKKKKAKKEKKEPKKEKKPKKAESVEQEPEPEPLLDYYPDEGEEPMLDEHVAFDPMAEEHPELRARIKRLYTRNPEAVRRIIEDVKRGRAGVELEGLTEEQLNDIIDMARIEATSKLDRKVGTLAINKLTQALDYKMYLDGEFSKEVDEDEILQELAGEMMSENVLGFVPKPIVFGMLYSTHAGSAYVKNRRRRPRVPLNPVENESVESFSSRHSHSTMSNVKLVKPKESKPVVVKGEGEVSSDQLKVF